MPWSHERSECPGAAGLTTILEASFRLRSLRLLRCPLAIRWVRSPASCAVGGSGLLTSSTIGTSTVRLDEVITVLNANRHSTLTNAEQRWALLRYSYGARVFPEDISGARVS